MAACVTDMNDVALKPRLLGDLSRKRIPDEEGPFRKVLEKIIRAVRTHKLLSEPSGGSSADEKVVKDWASAVAEWVHRVQDLASSNSITKCWAGVSLLGLTCQECSSKRFLESYPLWIEKLQAHIEPATDSPTVKLAACATLGDLLARLGPYHLSHGKGGFAEKLVQQSLNLLNEESSEDILDLVLRLIGIMTTFFPSAIHRHYDSVEATIISKIFSGKCSNFLLKKLARCLAVLPKSKGNEGTWSLLMQRILLYVNDFLKDAFEDLEEENKSSDGITLLVPPGENPPPPLADYKSKPWSERTSIVSAMMICCSEMIRTSSSAQVSGFWQPLQALVDRVLMVDGSIPQTSLFATATQQQTLCLQLPDFHSSVLDLQIALIKCMRSEMRTRAPRIVPVITRYFKKCALPDLRVKVYSVMKTLLMSLGGGMPMNVRHEIMKNALVDLNPDHEKKISPSYTQSNVTNASGEQRSRKKWKRPSTAEPPGQQQNGDLELHAIKSPLMEHPELKIAALETLETLFTEGGPVKLGEVDVDAVLISLARKLFDAQRPSSEELQLAALRVLLASTLSQRARSPHFGKIRYLFITGHQASSSKVAEFCALAKLALGLLMHPQALPLSDYNLSEKFQSTAFLLGRTTAQKRSSTGFGLPDADDDISGAWLDEEVKGTKPAQDTPTAKSSKKKQKKKKQRLSDGSSDENAERSNETMSPVMVPAEKTMLDREPEPPTSESQEPTSPGPVLFPCTSRATKEAREDTSEDEEMGVGGNAVVNGQDDAPLSASHIADVVMPDLDKGKEQLQDPDHESADDEFPDIIDMDPGSDDE